MSQAHFCRAIFSWTAVISDHSKDNLSFARISSPSHIHKILCAKAEEPHPVGTFLFTPNRILGFLILLEYLVDFIWFLYTLIYISTQNCMNKMGCVRYEQKKIVFLCATQETPHPWSLWSCTLCCYDWGSSVTLTFWVFDCCYKGLAVFWIYVHSLVSLLFCIELCFFYI